MKVDDLRSGTWVTFSGGEATGFRIRRCRLVVLSGSDSGRAVELESPIIRVGAGQGCGLRIQDARVSGIHCEISLAENGYRLRDLQSTNGTFVGDLRIDNVYLEPGARFRVGETIIRFELLDDSVSVDLAKEDSFEGLVGRSVRMRAIFAMLYKLCESDVTVLVTGETGVGKELVAEAVHRRSNRASGPFVIVDCGSIPETLIESELFGHEKGAFTGAVATHAGAFERAHGGVLFLDEIGELPLEMQPKLLRAIEHHQIRRVGGSKTVDVSIRVVAATNRDLEKEISRGRFREDLFYRLAVAQIIVPPLRDRFEDISLLSEHILKQIPGGESALISEQTMDMMMKHDWPGNVRELRNVIERAVLLQELPAPRTRQATETTLVKEGQASATDPEVVSSVNFGIDLGVPFKVAKQSLVNLFERAYVEALLKAHGGNISAAARAAGLDRMSIHKILNRHGISNPGR